MTGARSPSGRTSKSNGTGDRPFPPVARPTPNPTVLYDNERPSSTLPHLEEPDVDAILRRRRRWYHALRHWELSRRWQLALTGTSIVLSAVQANGVYCWPTYGPVVSKQLQLDSTQAQTIVVGGILGVYICAAPLGSLIDRSGPRTGSLVSAFLSALGYLSFAALLTQSPDTPYIHLYLTLAYFCVGAATVGSYFACLTTASLSFPSHPTLSLSVPLSLLGLSSMILASFSTLQTFQSPNHELDASKFIVFLGIICPIVNLVGAVFMKVVPQPGGAIQLPEDTEVPGSPISQLLHLDEHTPLLIGGPEAARQDVEEELSGKGVKWTAWGLVKDWEGFWLFGMFLALCIGPSETVIASMGSFLTSLLPPETRLFLSAARMVSTTDSALGLRNKHVFILSMTGTLARLFTGFTADYLSPPLVAVGVASASGNGSGDDLDAPVHIFARKRKQILSRGVYAALCAFCLAGVFGWSSGFLETERGLWVLSGGTGALYGALFTLAPAIVSSHFGATNFGLAWGMVSYFAALGSVLFSYTYALLAESVAVEGQETAPTMCYGPKCFRATLAIAAGCCVLASIGFVWIGRRWKV